jgi:hypothetical protein
LRCLILDGRIDETLHWNTVAYESVVLRYTQRIGSNGYKVLELSGAVTILLESEMPFIYRVTLMVWAFLELTVISLGRLPHNT